MRGRVVYTHHSRRLYAQIKIWNKKNRGKATVKISDQKLGPTFQDGSATNATATVAAFIRALAGLFARQRVASIAATIAARGCLAARRGLVRTAAQRTRQQQER